MLGVFWKVQEICNKMGIIICKIFEDMSKIIEPKVGNPKNSVSRNWAILTHPWKYKNEIAPTFYYRISTKTNEKDLKIPNLQPPDWKHPYWMTL